MTLRAQDIIDIEMGAHYQIAGQNTIMSAAHDHDFFEIFLVVDGSMEHVVNGVAQNLGKNTLFFIHPEDEHSYRRIKGSLLNIAFTQEVFEQINTLLSVCSFRQSIISNLDTEYFMHEVSKIQAYNYSKREISVKLKVLLVNIFSLFIKKEKLVEYPVWFTELLDTMNSEQNIATGLKQLYHLSPKSPEHTTRMFRKHLNQTPT